MVSKSFPNHLGAGVREGHGIEDGDGDGDLEMPRRCGSW